jgi:hypothetical protein
MKQKRGKGKGPFARLRRPDPPDYQSPRWTAPRVELNAESCGALLEFLREHNETGLRRLFQGLAGMRPEYRLTRNLGALLRCMAQADVSDVLQNGLSVLENGALMTLEQLGASLEVLGVAHTLLDIRARQMLVGSVGDQFLQAKSQRETITPDEGSGE